jgi:hypothetical protein
VACKQGKTYLQCGPTKPLSLTSTKISLTQFVFCYKTCCRFTSIILIQTQYNVKEMTGEEKEFSYCRNFASASETAGSCSRQPGRRPNLHNPSHFRQYGGKQKRDTAS